jgi:hypothetical protein
MKPAQDYGRLPPLNIHLDERGLHARLLRPIVQGEYVN